MLANVDADLCAQVAAGLGLPAPKGSPAEDVVAVAGAVADRHRARPDRRPQDRRHRRRRLRPGRHRASCARRPPSSASTVLVIAPVGGVLEAGAARSSPSTGRCSPPARSSSTRSSSPAAPPRPATSSSSCCCRRPSGTARRSAPGATATAMLEAAGITVDEPGRGRSATRSARPSPTQLVAALGLHRAWDRAPDWSWPRPSPRPPEPDRETWHGASRGGGPVPGARERSCLAAPWDSVAFAVDRLSARPRRARATATERPEQTAAPPGNSPLTRRPPSRRPSEYAAIPSGSGRSNLVALAGARPARQARVFTLCGVGVIVRRRVVVGLSVSERQLVDDPRFRAAA